MISTNGSNGTPLEGDGMEGLQPEETVVGALDLADGNDRKLLRAKLAGGYEFTGERLSSYRAAAEAALAKALRAATDEKREGETAKDVEYRQRYGCRSIRSMVALLDTMVGKAQAEEFVNLRNDRIDRGNFTERVEISVEDRQRIARLAAEIEDVRPEDI
jgi:hypothetical protein